MLANAHCANCCAPPLACSIAPHALDDLEGADAAGVHGYIQAGISPRSDADDNDDYRDADDEKEAKVRV